MVGGHEGWCQGQARAGSTQSQFQKTMIAIAPGSFTIRSLVFITYLVVCNIIKQVVDVSWWLNVCLWRIERMRWGQRIRLKCRMEVIQVKYLILRKKKTFFMNLSCVWIWKSASFHPFLVCIRRCRPGIGLGLGLTLTLSFKVYQIMNTVVKMNIKIRWW